jgi:uncharacterized protein YceH (UPF0502 family)
VRRDLTTPEIRVLGCLLEKQRTTPDGYPLSLNSLRLACNQSTNRDPVVDYDEATIREALGALGRRHWIRSASGHGGRAVKYRHLLEDELPLPDGETALLAVLMLRGPQTPGELKQRSARLHAFADIAAVLEDVEGLIARDLVRQLPRLPGQKEQRYEQLLGADLEDEDAPRGEPMPAPAAGLAVPAAAGPDELEELRATVAALTGRVERLERELGVLADEEALR